LTLSRKFLFKDKEQSPANNFKTNIIKVNLLANVSLFTIQHLQSNLNAFTGYGIYIYKRMVQYYKNGYIVRKEQMNRKKRKQT
jgi:hypothetical protein